MTLADLRLWIASMFFFFSQSIAGQNLVPNPGFEEYLRCPTQEADFNGFVRFWATFFSDPDYFNLCGYYPSWIEERADPFEGKAVAGARLYNNSERFSNVNREYIHTSLIEPLKPGQLYHGQYYFNPMSYGYNIDSYGMYFSAWPLNDTPASGILLAEPQVENQNGLILDFDTWQRVSGCFTAQGGERYIAIGNFRADEETDTLSPGFAPFPVQSNYTLIDAVSLYEVASLVPSDTLLCMTDSIFTLPAVPHLPLWYQQDGARLDSALLLSQPGKFDIEVWLDPCGVVGSFSVTIDSCLAAQPRQGCPAYIPNAFSPNGDGTNDTFVVSIVCEPASAVLRIFNRWGSLVYEANGKEAEWDGLIGGRPAPVDTYVYLLEIGYHDESGTVQAERFSGEVILMR
jgi:gliding motility-associated-like protein